MPREKKYLLAMDYTEVPVGKFLVLDLASSRIPDLEPELWMSLLSPARDLYIFRKLDNSISVRLEDIECFNFPADMPVRVLPSPTMVLTDDQFRSYWLHAPDSKLPDKMEPNEAEVHESGC